MNQVIEFLMLGIIPGTHIQIGFKQWLAVILVMLIALVVISGVRRLLMLLPYRSPVRTGSTLQRA